MTEQKKNLIAATLIELDTAFMQREYTATSKRDFEKLKEIAEQRDAITILLEAIERL